MIAVDNYKWAGTEEYMVDKYSVIINVKNEEDAVFISNHLKSDNIDKLYICIDNDCVLKKETIYKSLHEINSAITVADDINVVMNGVVKYLKLLFDCAELWESKQEVVNSVNLACDMLEGCSSGQALNVDELRNIVVGITVAVGSNSTEKIAMNYELIQPADVGTINADYIIGECGTEVKGENLLNLTSLYEYFWSQGPERYWLLHNNSDTLEYSGIILGMSYLQRGINLERLHYKTSCMAAPAQDMYYNLKMLEYALAKSEYSELKYCVLEMAPYSLWYDLSKSREQGHRSIYYYPQTHSMHNYEKAREYIEEYERLMGMYVEICDDNLILDKFMSLKESNHWYENRDTEIWANSNNKESAVSEVYKLFNKPYEDTYNENISILENIIQILTSKSIIPIIVIPPYTALFQENMNRNMLSKTKDVLESVKRKFSEVVVLDYLSDADFDDYYFADVSHLNYWGSNLLSNKLNVELDKLSTKYEW